MPTVYLTLLVSALWLLWSGHYDWLLLSFGLVSTIIVVYLCRAMNILDEEIAPLQMTIPTLRYVPWLAWAVLQSNYDVVKRVLNPKLPISPRLLKVKASQKTDLGRATYANSITLTPGTLTMDAEDGRLMVHALSREAADELAAGEMDTRITRLEKGYAPDTEEDRG